MLRLTARNIAAQKLRFLMTTFAVVMGVGFVVGSLVVTDSLRGSVDTLFTEITAGVDISVRAETNLGGGSDGELTARGRVPAALVDQVRKVEGVAAAEPVIGGYAQLLDLEGEPVTTTGAPFLGVSWGREAALRPATIDQGRSPKGVAEVAIDRGTAQDYGFELGDRTSVLLANGTRPEVEIVGIFTFGDANNLLGARLTAFDVDVASEVLGVAGQADSIDVSADPGEDLDLLADRIQQAMPADVEAVTGAQVTDESKDSIAGFVDAFQNILLGFAAIALFVSAFFINNTFSIIVGQRTKQLALLRSLGATPQQVTRSVVAEGLAVGVLASVLGIGFGMVIAVVLKALLTSAGFGLPDQGLVLSIRTVVAAVVVGVGVTVLASVAPARRASAVPPVQGMRDGFVSSGWSRSRRIASGVALTSVGAVLGVVGLFVATGTPSIVAAVGLGAIAVFVGVALLSPVVAVPMAGRVGRVVAPLFHAVGRLAHANAVRHPDRTARTASALTIGLALVTTVFVVGTSMKHTFAATIEDSVAADYILSTDGFTGFSPTVTAQVGDLPEIDAITGVRFGQIKVAGKAKDVVAVDGAAVGKVVDIDVQTGDIDDLDARSIFLHEDAAHDLDVAAGDRVPVQFATGPERSLTVGGTYADAVYAGNYLIDLELLSRVDPANDLDLLAFAKLAPGTDPAAARSSIDAVLADHPQVRLDDRAGYQADQEAQFDSILIAVNGLLGLALFIALLGIANTLALSVLERTREIGLLRAVGMLRRQTREMVLLESAMVAVFGAVLGVALGLVFGVAVSVAMPESVIAGPVIPFASLGVIVVIAAGCGVVAGLLPARRAARLDVLQAIASD